MLTGRDKVGDIFSGRGCHIPSPSMGTTLRQSVRFIGGGGGEWGKSKAWPLRRVYRETVDLTSKAWIPLPVPQANPSPRASPTFPIATSTDPHDFSEPVSGQRGRGTPGPEAEEVSLLPQAFMFSISFLCPCVSEMYTLLYKFSLLPQSSWVNIPDFYP